MEISGEAGPATNRVYLRPNIEIRRIDMSEIYYDPYDFEIDSDPHPVWRSMRDDAPRYRNEKYDFWALSRFDDVDAALVDWQSYTEGRCRSRAGRCAHRPSRR